MSKTKNNYIQHIQNNELIQYNIDHNRWYCILCGISFLRKPDVRRHLFGNKRQKLACKVIKEQNIISQIGQIETDSDN